MIDKLIQEAMKAKNKVELRAYKNLKAEIQAFKTAKNAKPYDKATEIQIISKMCKKLEDDISIFSEAHREDLVSEYRDELEVLRKLLPEPVSDSEIESELMEWGRLNSLTQTLRDMLGYEERLMVPKKEMGNAIKYLKSKFPQVDGKRISEIVKKCTVL